MFKNYLIIAFRNFLRRPGISAINVLGLSLGISACFIATLYLKQEIITNTSIKDLEFIHRVGIDDGSSSSISMPYPVTGLLQSEYFEVKEGLRLSDVVLQVKIDNNVFQQEIVLTDSNYFDFFSLTLKSGNGDRALSGIKDLVLSEAAAKKYFGDADPLGKTVQLMFNGKYEDFQVTGVANEFVGPVSLYFDFLISNENYFVYGGNQKDDWSYFFTTSFVKVDPSHIGELKKKTQRFVKNYMTLDSTALEFVPLSDHHLGLGMAGSGLKGGVDEQNLKLFSIIALSVLLIAGFNYMNLTNAISSKRASEVGIRKVTGAFRHQLVRQFLAESIFMSLISFAFALGIAELSLIVFQELLGAPLTLFDSDHLDVFIFMLVVTLITGILSGFYPSFILSNLPIIKTFNRAYTIGGTNKLTRAVMVVQFFIAIVLIVGTLSMWKQNDYLMKKDLGFDQENLLVVSFNEADSGIVNVFKDRAATQPAILNVARASGSFTRSSSVAIVSLPDKSQTRVFKGSIDENYIQTMDMKLIKGRSFTSDDAKDPSRIIVNETFIRKFNIGDSIGVALGRSIVVQHPVIVGVVKDYNYLSLRSNVDPMLLRYHQKTDPIHLMIRLKAGEIAEGLNRLKSIWAGLGTDSPFNFYFLDQDLATRYETEKRWSQIITVATSLAILLSILGLLGLALYTAERRRKEISIRKVLGASVSQLVALLSKNYVLLICVAFVMAVPVSYYLVTRFWLSRFVYRVELGYSTYVTTIVMILLIALIAVSTQTLRAALQNPTDVLKEE